MKADVAEMLRETADRLTALAECVRTLSLSLGDVPEGESVKVPTITLEEVRGVLAEKSRDGYTAEVREIIKSFGSERLSDIDPSRYDAVLKKAEELGNG